MPQRLGTLELIATIEGSDALAQIRELHGIEIELVSAYIASYVQGNERVTVWVGEAESNNAAAELTRRMVEGIERGGSGFGNLQRLTITGHEVFQVKGPGGEHFFYHSAKLRERVVWLTIEADDALSILEQAVNNF